MRLPWMTGFALLCLVGMIISLTLEGQYLGENEHNVFWAVMSPDFGSFTNPISAIGGFFIMVWDWIKAVWAILTWNYSFLEGSFKILRYIGIAGSLAMVVSLVLAVRGTGSS